MRGYVTISVSGFPVRAIILCHWKIMHSLSQIEEMCTQQKQKYFLEINPNAPFTLLELEPLYGDSGMDGKKEETMDRFFVIFSESTVNLKRFIDGMRVSAESESAFHSHQQQLLRFLAEECLQAPKTTLELHE